MAAPRRAAKHEIKATQQAGGQARSLAESMPRLILEARRIAATVIHGLHGRRRAPALRLPRRAGSGSWGNSLEAAT